MINRLLLCLTTMFLVILIAAPTTATHSASRQPCYWIWAGISVPSDSLESNLYIYQGVFRKNRHSLEYQRKGLYPHYLPASEVYLVFRLEELDHSQSFKNAILTIISHWELKKTIIRGIQIDFDSPTGKLERYYHFLKDVRSWLPSRYALTITGLGDWLLFAQPKVLHALSSCTDSIVFQLYSGRRYVPNLERYLHELQLLDIPFKIGLLSDNAKNTFIESTLQQNAHFNGSIYFIQKTHKEIL